MPSTMTLLVITGSMYVQLENGGPRFYKPPHLALAYCHRGYPGLGYRSVFYPYSSVVGNTVTFEVVQVTSRSRVRISFRTFLLL